MQHLLWLFLITLLLMADPVSGQEEQQGDIPPGGQYEWEIYEPGQEQQSGQQEQMQQGQHQQSGQQQSQGQQQDQQKQQQMGGQQGQGQPENIQVQEVFSGRIDRAGDRYVLMVNGNAYALEAQDQSRVENLVGREVAVQGWLQGQTIRANTIETGEAAKKLQERAGKQGQGGGQQQQSQ